MRDTYYRIDALNKRARTNRHLNNAVRIAERLFSEQSLADPPDVVVRHVDPVSAISTYEVGRVTVQGWRYSDEA